MACDCCGVNICGCSGLSVDLHVTLSGILACNCDGGSNTVSINGTYLLTYDSGTNTWTYCNANDGSCGTQQACFSIALSCNGNGPQFFVLAVVIGDNTPGATDCSGCAGHSNIFFGAPGILPSSWTTAQCSPFQLQGPPATSSNCTGSIIATVTT